MHFGCERTDNFAKSFSQGLQGPTDLRAALSFNAGRRPHAMAFREIDGSGSVIVQRDWAAFCREVDSIASQLRPCAAPSERVLVPQGAPIAFAESLLGCMAAGAIAVPTAQPRSRRRIEEVLAIARDCGATAALIEERGSDLLAEALRAEGIAVVHPGGPVEGGAAAPAPAPAPARRRDEPAVLQYTSGSTSRPKGVVLTESNLVANAAAIAEALAVTEASRFLSWLPLFHDMGLVTSLFVPILTGAESLFMPPRAFSRDPALWLELIGRHAVSHSGGPGFGFNLCSERVADERLAELDLSSWQCAFLGAEPISEDMLARFAGRFAAAAFDPAAFQPCYGLAESTLMATASPPHGGAVVRSFSREGLRRRTARAALPGESVRRLVSCGRPPRGASLIIASPETLEQAGPGEVGEIWLSGPSIGAGYWQAPEATAQAFIPIEGGSHWLRTGDLGFVDDGDLFVAGRLKETLILRGRTHHPHDIEAAAASAHPDLVPGEAAAFALDLPDREGFAIACVLRRGALRHFNGPAVAASIRLAALRAAEADPDAVLLVRPAALPRTSSGKLRRAACRHLLDLPGPETMHLWRRDERTGRPVPLRAGAPAFEIRRWMCGWVANRFGIAPEDIAADLPFEEIGLDSIASVELAIALSVALDRPVDENLMWTCPTIEALAAHLTAEPRPAPTPSIGRLPAPGLLDRLRAGISGAAQ